jgi:hypothetical protein
LAKPILVPDVATVSVLGPIKVSKAMAFFCQGPPHRTWGIELCRAGRCFFRNDDILDGLFCEEKSRWKLVYRKYKAAKYVAERIRGATTHTDNNYEANAKEARLACCARTYANPDAFTV